VKVRYLSCYGGTELSPEESEFMGLLARKALEQPEIVLVTGGFQYSLNEPEAISVDVSVLNAAKEFLSSQGASLEDRLETWLPERSKDRDKVVRFREGKPRELTGKSAQARRFKLVRDVDVLITLRGIKNTAMVLDLALAIDKPVFPLPFLCDASWKGNDSREYWKQNRDQILAWFDIPEDRAKRLEETNLAALTTTVLYELGHAHARGIVPLLCSSDAAQELPFYLLPHRVEIWNPDSEQGHHSLIQVIEAYVEEIRRRTRRPLREGGAAGYSPSL
jgi:hypothetical protein